MQNMSAMMFGDVTTVGHRPSRPQSHRVHDEAISQADFLLALKLALVCPSPETVFPVAHWKDPRERSRYRRERQDPG